LFKGLVEFENSEVKSKLTPVSAFLLRNYIHGSLFHYVCFKGLIESGLSYCKNLLNNFSFSFKNTEFHAAVLKNL